MPTQEMSLNDVADFIVAQMFTDPAIRSAKPDDRPALIAARFNALVKEESKRQLDEFKNTYEKERDDTQQAMQELQARVMRKEEFRAQNAGLRRMSNGLVRPEVSDACARGVAEAVRDSLYAKRDVGQHSSGVAGEGGVFIPQEFAAEIIRLIPTFGVYPRIARNIPMTVAKINFGRLLSGLRMSYPDENAKINRTYANFGPLVLEAKLVAGMTDAPRTLLSDASVELGNLYIDLMLEGLAGEYDFQGFVAKTSDSEPFDGVLYKSGIKLQVTEGRTSILKSSVYDLLPMQTLVPDGGRAAAVYVLHPTTLNHYQAERTTEGAPITGIITPPTGNEPGKIFGRPYETSEKMPSIADDGPGKRFVLYGDPRLLFFGDMQQLSVERSQTAGEAFERHQELFKVTNRFAVNSHAEGMAALETDA
jgi:HK97 family phage major capsid protein